MYSKHRQYSLLIIIWLVLVAPVRAQDNPQDDADLKEFLKQAAKMQEKSSGLQKQNPAPFDVEKKFSEMQAAMKEAAQQQQEEQRDQEKLLAALKNQLAAPGPVALPDWTPGTPQFKPSGSPTKKIVGNEVRIVQAGTSSLTPEELADGWESAAEAKNLNHSRTNVDSNGRIAVMVLLNTRTDPVQEVKFEASREPNSEITQVEISSALPKPDIGRE
jgi:hypothetical protein